MTISAELLGRRIRYRRRMIDMTQEQLAALLGTRQVHVADWERGAYRPRPARLEAIARVLETPLDYFLEEGELVRK